jgi:hypothetical protein
MPMLKLSLIVSFLLLLSPAFPQKNAHFTIDNNDTIFLYQTKYLEPVDGLDSLKTGKSIIYGSFVQRHGLKDDHCVQRILVKNTDLKTYFFLQVDFLNKYKSHKLWAFHIPPGSYEIVRYDFCESLVYFTVKHKEIINDNATNSAQNFDRFKFKIETGSLNYCGVWNFYEEDPFFFDSKEYTDKKLRKTYFRLDLKGATKNLPK